jgi:alkanesulfonate monooxygenase SsuD/methylene tetrahydromethanopterin reductase-like flavin-dependent oxidoreductase (luciferase family)
MAERTMRLALALNGYGLTHRLERGIEREVLPWHELLLIAETAEETGYEAIFTPEIHAREAFVTLTGFAAATNEIRLATGVVPITSRTPDRVALAAATLQDVADGRFILGLGSEISLDRTRSHIRSLRELFGGGQAVVETPEGSVVATPIDLAAGEGVDVPIFLGALGPRMTELAGEVADGVILNWCTPDRVADARTQLARGASRAGRDPGRIVVSVYVRACLGHDEGHALAALREAAGQYAALEKYRSQFVAMGLGAEAEAAASAWTSGSLDEVPLSLLAAVCVRGTREEALRRLDEYAQAGADLVVVYPVPAQEAVSSTMGTALAAAPNPAVEA